mmetsp:Transcript_467/g.1188  ORF Transcript_467/g.1188 Transcript_467/m.1188 type:complete len:372 (+) Transcript_467:141-1256(+)
MPVTMRFAASSTGASPKLPAPTSRTAWPAPTSGQRAYSHSPPSSCSSRYQSPAPSAQLLPTGSRVACSASSTPRATSRQLFNRESRMITPQRMPPPMVITPLCTPPLSHRDSSGSSSSMAAGLHAISTLELLSSSAALAHEHSSRVDQLEELERLIADSLAEMAGPLEAPPSARLGACLILMRAEMAEISGASSGTTTPPPADLAETSNPTASEEVAAGFVETIGTVHGQGNATLRFVAPSANARPREIVSACCGRGPWLSGESNGIISFSFSILASKLGDGGRMRLGIVAKGARGQMDCAHRHPTLRRATPFAARCAFCHPPPDAHPFVRRRPLCPPHQTRSGSTRRRDASARHRTTWCRSARWVNRANR